MTTRPGTGKGRVRVAVDALGGDYAPEEIVKGAVKAAGEGGVEIILVGPVATTERELSKYPRTGLSLRLEDAEGMVREDEPPAMALRQKPNASVFVAARLVKGGKADAFVSLGSTGAVMVSAFQFLGVLEGLQRPVLGIPISQFAPNTLVIDCGANVDCKPAQFLDFAVIGAVAARTYLRVANPTVALLSTGAEEGKGNHQVKEAYDLLKDSGLNFIGNIESIDIPAGKANVVVCDGFVGNVLMKFNEGLGTAMAGLLGQRLKGKLPALEVEGIVEEVRQATNYTEYAGGGPLLGVNGIAVVGHGRSRAPAVAGAIAMAKTAVETGFVADLKAELARVRKNA